MFTRHKALSRLAIASVLFVLLLSASACGTQGPSKQGTTDAKNASPDHVVLNLNWLPEYPYYWAALDQGFWAEQNLDVKIVRGYGSVDTVTKIATKKAEFGIADIGSLIMARAKEDIKVKAVANYTAEFPAVIIFSKASGITVPKDLEGKTIVGSPSSAYTLFWPAFAKANGIDESKVNWKMVDPALQDTAFLRGEADAVTAHIEDVPAMAEVTGEPVRFFSYKDDGRLDRYSDSLIVHEDLIAQNPDQVRRFITGFLKGVRYSLENPAKAGEIVKKYVPEIDAGAVVKSWQATMDNNLIVTGESQQKGLGWMSEDRMAKTIASVLNAYDLQKDITPEAIYTTEFLPQAPVFPPQK